MNNFTWYKPWTWFTKEEHIQIRQTARTLNTLNFIEIMVILFFTYIAYDLIYFVMEQIEKGNNHIVLGALATGVFIPLTGGIWGMLKSINHTFKNNKEEKD